MRRRCRGRAGRDYWRQNEQRENTNARADHREHPVRVVLDSGAQGYTGEEMNDYWMQVLVYLGMFWICENVLLSVRLIIEGVLLFRRRK